LLSDENLDELESANGLCIVYTHFGTPGFVNADGVLDDRVGAIFESLRKRDVWVAPVSEILNYIEEQRGLTPLNLTSRIHLRLKERKYRIY